MCVVVRVENVSKKYQLGKIGTQSLKGDFQRWWARQRGKEDPFARIGEAGNERSGEFWALRGVSFDIRQGEAVGIIGKNGAGKSTLLKILSRITLPTTGRLRVKGRIASLLEVGTGFNPDLTGRENIFLNGAILGMTRQEVSRNFDEIVAFSGIENFIDTPVKRYSSGMHVRLAFAVAAHLESEILILDEVLAVGDAEFQRKCLAKMESVTKKEGRTVLFVSHAMGSVGDLCTKAIYLKKGNVYLQGDTHEVIKKYNLDNEVQAKAVMLQSDDPAKRRGIGAVRYTDIKVYGEDGQEKEEYLPGETVVFRLQGMLEEEVPELFATIALRGGKHKDIVTSIRREPIDIGGLRVGDTFSFEVALVHLNLRPGAYNLYYWLGSSRNEYPYDVIDGLTPPLIIGFPQGANPVISGYFDVDYTFRQHKNALNNIS